ncbi:MAG: hypothetical protein IJ532_06370 [Alphaproteobacteria bacterium]|nr:hypothetical protein [Alphaproteobacteria bacterium]
MNRDFNNAEIEQVYDDFNSRTTDFDVALEDGIKDLTQVISEVKNKRDGYAVSDEISELFNDCRDKIALGFNETTSANRKQWAPQLANILISTMNMNFRNADSVIRTVDEILETYDKNPRQYSEVYKAFYKVYTHAVRRVRNPETVKHSSEMANNIFNKIEILKGSGTPDKYLARLVDNPQKDIVSAFEKSLKNELATDPEKTAHNLLKNIKTITQIKDSSVRDKAYEILFENLKSMLEKSAAESNKSPENMKMIENGMFKIFDLEKATGLWDKAEEHRTPFEVRMQAKKKKFDNKMRLNKQILTLLNIPSKELGIERDPNKSYYPSKKEMLIVANLLSQYPKIEHNLAIQIMGKIDDKQFSNVDDRILDKISSVTSRMQYGEEIEEQLTGIRAQMHSRGIQDKREQDAQHIVEMSPSTKDKQAPTTHIVFDVKDLPNGTEVRK